jgi:hypothetical protein
MPLGFGRCRWIEAGLREGEARFDILLFGATLSMWSARSEPHRSAETTPFEAAPMTLVV